MNPRHVTAAVAIAYVHFITDGTVTLNVNRIRVWSHRHNLRRGTDPDGYALYDLDQIVRRATLRHESQPCNLGGGGLRPEAKQARGVSREGVEND